MVLMNNSFLPTVWPVCNAETHERLAWQSTPFGCSHGIRACAQYDCESTERHHRLLFCLSRQRQRSLSWSRQRPKDAITVSDDQKTRTISLFTNQTDGKRHASVQCENRCRAFKPAGPTGHRGQAPLPACIAKPKTGGGDPLGVWVPGALVCGWFWWVGARGNSPSPSVSDCLHWLVMLQVLALNMACNCFNRPRRPEQHSHKAQRRKQERLNERKTCQWFTFHFFWALDRTVVFRLEGNQLFQALGAMMTVANRLLLFWRNPVRKGQKLHAKETAPGRSPLPLCIKRRSGSRFWRRLSHHWGAEWGNQ